MADDDDTPKTFTEDEVNEIVAKRLKRAPAKVPADYEELKAKAKKYDDAQADAEATESKTNEKLAELEKDLADERLKRIKAEVAAAKGLTPAQAKRLNGETREELEVDADDILENLPAATTSTKDEDKDEHAKTPPSRRPRPDLKGGTNPTGESVETDPAKLADLVPNLY